MKKIAEGRNIRLMVIRAKECTEEFFEAMISEEFVVKKISTILQFTSSGESFKPAFDVLATYNCSTINCLLEHIEKEMRPDVAMWIRARLRLLSSFINGGGLRIPTCLANYDEPIRRIVVGLLYAAREKITMPIVLDDMLSFVLNEAYRDAFIAMARPFKVSINERLDTHRLLSFNPIIITPGGNEIYRLTRPGKYVILFDHFRWELDRKAVEKIAYS